MHRPSLGSLPLDWACANGLPRRIRRIPQPVSIVYLFPILVLFVHSILAGPSGSCVSYRIIHGRNSYSLLLISMGAFVLSTYLNFELFPTYLLKFYLMLPENNNFFLGLTKVDCNVHIPRAYSQNVYAAAIWP